jgi:hypothetical protein
MTNRPPQAIAADGSREIIRYGVMIVRTFRRAQA